MLSWSWSSRSNRGGYLIDYRPQWTPFLGRFLWWHNLQAVRGLCSSHPIFVFPWTIIHFLFWGSGPVGKWLHVFGPSSIMCVCVCVCVCVCGPYHDCGIQYDTQRRAVSLQQNEINGEQRLARCAYVLYCSIMALKSISEIHLLLFGRWRAHRSVRRAETAAASVQLSVLIYGREREFGCCFVIDLANYRSVLSYIQAWKISYSRRNTCEDGWFGSGYLASDGDCDSPRFRGYRYTDDCTAVNRTYCRRRGRQAVADSRIYSAEERKSRKSAAQLVDPSSSDDRRCRYSFPWRLLRGPDNRSNTRLPLPQGAEARPQERQVRVC